MPPNYQPTPPKTAKNLSDIIRYSSRMRNAECGVLNLGPRKRVQLNRGRREARGARRGVEQGVLQAVSPDSGCRGEQPQRRAGCGIIQVWSPGKKARGLER
jgi:hypothetical protein